MKKNNFITILILLLIIVFIIGGIGSLFLIKHYQEIINNLEFSTDGDQVSNQEVKFTKFKSEQELNSYVQNAKNLSSFNSYSYYDLAAPEKMLTEDYAADSMLPTAAGSENTASRYSQTNVQVSGIDEPDIIKTNGSQIFYSQEPNWYYPVLKEGFELDSISSDYNSYYNQGQTKVINAMPVDEIKNLTSIENYGNLLLIKDQLIILGYDSIYSYNISKPDQPEKNWEYNFSSDTEIFSARVLDGQLYLILKTNFYQNISCPLYLFDEQTDFVVNCNEIYHPTQVVPADATYHILIIDPISGQRENSLSFLGASSNTNVYLSNNNVYVSFDLPVDYTSLFLDFIKNNQNLFPESINQKINRLNGYDISSGAKLYELQTIINIYLYSLDEDSRIKFENDLENSIQDYLKANIRKIESTQISKITAKELSLVSTTKVPGQILNQFSLDEYNNNLRVATTIGQSWLSYPFSYTSSESISDVYVLDQNLNKLSEATDMGKGERIYSVRFVQDQGYVVTFKETDPFYVLDLSNPANISITGELKIPGYSSYLHPINEKLILGIGKEDNNVKLSLFDVSDPKNPVEKDKYSLKEYWSDILDTHHAYLQDSDHSIFFLPGTSASYIFSYQEDKLKLVKAVEIESPKRAVYIDNNLYILGSNELIVLDENNWEKISRLELN